MQPSSIEEKLKEEFAAKVAKAVEEGGCPHCGSMIHVDHPEGRQCHNCGMTFVPKKKGETA